MTVKMGKCRCLLYALIVPVNHKMDVKPTHICTSNSLCLHTEGLFFFLVLLLVDLSHCVYCRWIILHFHLERSWEKKKRERDWSVVGFYGRLSLNVFVWKSCTDQCEIYSLLEVAVCSQRHFQGWLAGGGQGLGVYFLFIFLAMSSGWECSVAGDEAHRNKTRYWLNNLCVIW